MLQRLAPKPKAVVVAPAGVVVLAISVAAGEAVLGETAAGDERVLVAVAVNAVTDDNNRSLIELQQERIESQISGSFRLTVLFCLCK